MDYTGFSGRVFQCHRGIKNTPKLAKHSRKLCVFCLWHVSDYSSCGKQYLLLCMICMRKECSKKTSVVKNFNKAEPQANYIFIVTHICKGVIMFKGCQVPYVDNGKI